MYLTTVSLVVVVASFPLAAVAVFVGGVERLLAADLLSLSFLAVYPAIAAPFLRPRQGKSWVR
jgi:hypothetical protein